MPDLKSNDMIITECKVGLKTRERFWLIFAAVSESFAVSGQHGIGAWGGMQRAGCECGEGANDALVQRGHNRSPPFSACNK